MCLFHHRNPFVLDASRRFFSPDWSPTERATFRFVRRGNLFRKRSKCLYARGMRKMSLFLAACWLFGCGGDERCDTATTACSRC